jgi:hypothetical protein
MAKNAAESDPPTESNVGNVGSTGGHNLVFLAQLLHGLRFGQITLTVQDGVIVQVERTERIRLCRPR